MVYQAQVGHIRYPSRIWLYTSILFGILAICSVILALYCSDTLDCAYMYEDDGKKYCVIEIKE